MKIAIIEDDKITRLELSKLLNSHGYETVLLTDQFLICRIVNNEAFTIQTIHRCMCK